jgi:hypothetical protein
MAATKSGHAGFSKAYGPAKRFDFDDSPADYAGLGKHGYVRLEPDEAPTEPAPVVENWQDSLTDAFVKHIDETRKARLAIVLLRLDDRLEKAEAAIAHAAGGPMPVRIATLVEQELTLRREIPVVVRPEGDEEYVAMFVEANLASSGDTVHEAVDNLKDFMAEVFRKYSSLPPQKLGPGPKKQLQVLKQFIG